MIYYFNVNYRKKKKTLLSKTLFYHSSWFRHSFKIRAMVDQIQNGEKLRRSHKEKMGLIEIP